MLRRRKPQYKSLRRLHLGVIHWSGRPLGRTSPSWEEKAGGGKGGEGRRRGNEKGVKGAPPPPLREIFPSPKKKKRGREVKRFREEEAKGKRINK